MKHKPHFVILEEGKYYLLAEDLRWHHWRSEILAEHLRMVTSCAGREKVSSDIGEHMTNDTDVRIDKEI